MSGVGEGRTARLYLGDCLDALRTMPAASVDAVVCDPPYELGFMGKSWDASGVAFDPATWREALRVLKPGGHLLAFGGTRTYHRMTVAIEDAGFEIRDCLSWQYGSGFPKSLDVSKAIDKRAGAVRKVLSERAAYGIGGTGTFNGHSDGATAKITIPATDDARRWSGWGTALKPAWEPIVVARKPLEGTVAGNVLKHGTGALNIDGCRVGTEGGGTVCTNRDEHGHCRGHNNAGRSTAGETVHGPDTNGGRWPANVLFTHAPGCVRVGERTVGSGDLVPGDAVRRTSTMLPEGAGWNKNSLDNSKKNAPNSYGTETVPDYECAPGCPVAALDAQSGVIKNGNGMGGAKVYQNECGQFAGMGGTTKLIAHTNYHDTGGASRFFTVADYGPDDDLPGAQPGEAPFLYQSKAPRKEREAGCEGLPPKSAVEAVGRDPESVGAKSPRAGAGRGAGASKPICAECGIDLSGGSRPASRCAVSADGAHVVVNRGDERGALIHNHHPTVKPVAVMRWLCRLVTPPGGTVLDPFMGSGTTGIAALREGFDFIGCEREPEYLLIAEARIAHHAPDARLLGPGDP